MSKVTAWAVLDDGRVQVEREGDRGPSIPAYDGDEALAVLRAVEPWVPLATTYGEAAGVRPGYVLAFIYAESGGRAGAHAPDGGKGLMQLTHPSLTAGLSDAEVMKPETNVRIGAGLMGRLLRRVDGSENGLPRLASLYNAGGEPGNEPHPSAASPWGLRETPGHIDRVVRAANTILPWLAAGACS